MIAHPIGADIIDDFQAIFSATIVKPLPGNIFFCWQLMQLFFFAAKLLINPQQLFPNQSFQSGKGGIPRGIHKDLPIPADTEFNGLAAYTASNFNDNIFNLDLFVSVSPTPSVVLFTIMVEYATNAKEAYHDHKSHGKILPIKNCVLAVSY